MRQVRFGSYSIAATLAVTPSLMRLKSTCRYCCLWPPPRCRDVIRPCALRPPVFGLGPSSDFSGRDLVTSAKSDTVWKRRPGLVGLRARMPMTSSALEQRDLARRQGDDGPLGVGLGPEAVGAPRAAALALPVERVDLAHLDVPDRFDGVTDLGLAGRRVHLERVDADFDEGVALLRHDRSEDDVPGIFHSDSDSVLAVSTSSSDDGTESVASF